MGKEIRVIPGKGFVEAVISADFGPEEIVDAYPYIADEAAKAKAGGVLLNLSAVERCFSDMDRFFMASSLKNFRDLNMKVAVLFCGNNDLKDQFDSTVARNRGIVYERFFSREDALRWISSTGRIN